MKRWIHNSEDIAVKASDTKKLKRTPESGHSYDYPVTFNNFEEYKKWWEEDELYED